MSLSNNYRWVLIGETSIRNVSGAHPNAPTFSIQEIIDILESRCLKETSSKEYAKQTKKMWISHVDKNNNDYFKLLLHVGDKNASDVSYVHFDTLATRDVEKQENEGGQFSSHLIIKKQPLPSGNYLVFIEKVPNVYLGSVGDYITWACHAEEFYKELKDEEGRVKAYRPIVEILGHQSTTVREALRTGIFQDLELISNTVHPQGLDEDPLITEEISQLKLSVKRCVNVEQANSIFSKVRALIPDKFGKDRNPEVYIRVKSASGQIKRTQIDVGQSDNEDTQAVLEQAFVLNEKISNFDAPLVHAQD